MLLLGIASSSIAAAAAVVVVVVGGVGGGGVGGAPPPPQLLLLWMLLLGTGAYLISTPLQDLLTSPDMSSPPGHPPSPYVVCLRGVPMRQIRRLLDLLYRGEAEVPAGEEGEELEEFLALAKEMGVKGFTVRTSGTSCQKNVFIINLIFFRTRGFRQPTIEASSSYQRRRPRGS